MTDSDEQQGVASVANSFAEIVRAGMEDRRLRLEAEGKTVEATFVKAYADRVEILVRVGETDVDQQVKDEINELSSLVHNKLGASQEETYGTVLGDIIVRAGFKTRDMFQALEKARKRGRGRPITGSATDAFQLSLAGKSSSEVADALCERPDHRVPGYRHKYDDSCSDLFRKQIEKLRPLYDKYKTPGK